MSFFESLLRSSDTNFHQFLFNQIPIYINMEKGLCTNRFFKDLNVIMFAYHCPQYPNSLSLLLRSVGLRIALEEIQEQGLLACDVTAF